MEKEEIKDYLKRVDELGTKLIGEDKETYAWLIYGYNQCAKLLNETEQQCKKQKEVIDKALDIAYKYGQTDGGHHKMWVIDQMVRTLLKDDYDKFVKEYEKPDKNDDYYEWDTGIAP